MKGCLPEPPRNMARVLSNETSLSRQQKRMRSESQLLRRILQIEAGAAALFLLIGVVSWFLGRSTGWIWGGVALAFFAYAHFLKSKQNARDEQFMAAGLRGESEVAKMLTEGLDNTYYVYNDLSIRSGFHRAQIDHMVVSPKGIFLLETKNWRGRLSGDEADRKWTQQAYPDRPPRTLSSPILQNQRHIAVLSRFLRSGGVPEIPIISVIVFTGRNTSLDIKNQKTLLLWPRETVDHILRFRPKEVVPEATVDAVLKRMQRCV